jgi:RNA polymerase sigma-70 factor (ECF subfamily)
MSLPPDDSSLHATRQSLLLRLKDHQDQDGWREFFETYWRLIYSVCIKAKLSETEAEEIVQDTMVSVAKEMPSFRYDRTKGSFRSWLLTIVRRRLIDRNRKKARWERIIAPSDEADAPGSSEAVDQIDPHRSDLEMLWASEWEGHLLRRALEGVRSRVSEKQYLIYEMLMLRDVPLPQVVENLQTSAVVVHMAKYRVNRLLRQELTRLRREDGDA